MSYDRAAEPHGRKLGSERHVLRHKTPPPYKGLRRRWCRACSCSFWIPRRRGRPVELCARCRGAP